jgi:segregation and condensation protein A
MRRARGRRRAIMDTTENTDLGFTLPPAAPGEISPHPRFHLPVFEGPLDLLLYLIQKAEIDIKDIPILKITEQYSEYLEQMRELNLDIAADFILMAATLIQIKSRMLLPIPVNPEDGTPLEDPRAALVEQLLQYQRFKELSLFLKEREEVSLARYPRGAGHPLPFPDEDLAALDVDVFDLVQALQDVLRRASDSRERLIYAPEISLTACIGEVLDKLSGHGSLLFTEIFDPGCTRARIVVTFLALLELVKQRVVLLHQEEAFGPIRVVLTA